MLVPMSGPSARIGQAMLNAANLALLDLNRTNIRLSAYDSEAGAADASRKALAEGAAVILGPLFAADLRAVQAEVTDNRVAIISFTNDATLARSNSFIMGFQPTQEVVRVVEYARSRGLNRFGALTPQGRYGEVAGKALAAAATAAGGSLTAIESYPRERAKLFAPARRVANYLDRLSEARRAARTGGAGVHTAQLPPPPFEALLIPDTASYVKAFMPLMKSYGVTSPKVRFLGTGLWAADVGSLRTEPQLAGAWFATVADSSFNQMAQRYVARYGSKPPRIASLSYDAVLLVAAASRNWVPGQAFRADTLSNPAGFSGLDGAFRFSNGVAQRALEVDEITASGSRTVSPAPRSIH